MPEPVITRIQELIQLDIQLDTDRPAGPSLAVFAGADNDDGSADEFPTYISVADWRKFGRPVFIRVLISREKV